MHLFMGLGGRIMKLFQTSGIVLAKIMISIMHTTLTMLHFLSVSIFLCLQL